MSVQLPPPTEIAGHYNRLLKESGDYIHQRWQDSEIKRRHYRQTEAAIRFSLERLSRLRKVLEIGCGPAVWTTLYLPDAESATLLDISEEMLAQGKARLERFEGGRFAPRVKYLCGDFLDLDAPAESHHAVVSSRAFEYMSDKPAFVRKCFDVLEPGGSLLIVTKNEGWRDLRQTKRELAGAEAASVPVGVAMQMDLVSAESMTRMLDRAGFVDIVTLPAVFGSYHWPFMSRIGLAFADAIHRRCHRHSLDATPRVFRPLVESYVVTARKPARA